jgi:hypothetical protein
VVADRPLPPGRQKVGVAYVVGEGHRGTFTLLHGEVPVGTAAITGTLPLATQHGGAGLRLGFDAGLPVSERYAPPAPWTGTVHTLRVDTPGAAPADPAGEIREALHSE